MTGISDRPPRSSSAAIRNSTSALIPLVGGQSGEPLERNAERDRHVHHVSRDFRRRPELDRQGRGVGTFAEQENALDRHAGLAFAREVDEAGAIANPQVRDPGGERDLVLAVVALPGRREADPVVAAGVLGRPGRGPPRARLLSSASPPVSCGDVLQRVLNVVLALEERAAIVEVRARRVLGAGGRVLGQARDVDGVDRVPELVRGADRAARGARRRASAATRAPCG